MNRNIIVCLCIVFLFIFLSCYPCFAVEVGVVKVNESYEPPINIIFDVHIEPMDIPPSYDKRRIEVNWLRDTAINFGAKSSRSIQNIRKYKVLRHFQILEKCRQKIR